MIASDSRLDILQREVEESAILTIARRQPLAVDLRETISAIRVSGDVERIGDLAKNIAKRALAIGGQLHPQKIAAGVQHMTDLVLAQLKDVLDAYAQQDTVKAVDVWRGTGRSMHSTPRFSANSHLHDGRSAQYFVLHAPSVLCQEHRAYRRSHDEYRRDGALPRTGENLALDRPKNDRSIDATVGIGSLTWDRAF